MPLGTCRSTVQPPRTPRILTDRSLPSPTMSIFSSIPADSKIASNDLAFAIRDKYSVTDGYSLVIPNREFATWWDVTPFIEVRSIKNLTLTRAFSSSRRASISDSARPRNVAIRSSLIAYASRVSHLINVSPYSLY